MRIEPMTLRNPTRRHFVYIFHYEVSVHIGNNCELNIGSNLMNELFLNEGLIFLFKAIHGVDVTIKNKEIEWGLNTTN